MLSQRALLQDKEVFACQGPVAVKQCQTREVLQRIECGAVHGEVLHGVVACGTKQTCVVVAVCQIVFVAVVREARPVVHFQRVIVHPDLEEVLGEAACMHQCNGVVGGQRTVAQCGMFLCRLHGSLIVLLQQLHLHACERPEIGMAPRTDGSRAHNQGQHQGHLAQVLRQAFVLGHTYDGRQRLS